MVKQCFIVDIAKKAIRKGKFVEEDYIDIPEGKRVDNIRTGNVSNRL